MSKLPADAEKARLQQANIDLNHTAFLKPPAQLPHHPMATIQDDDERLLARIGYKQVCPHFPHRYSSILTKRV